MTPGLYRLNVTTKRFPTNQDHMGYYHTDDYEFHYLNSNGNWVDIGWGDPFTWDVDKLEPMTPRNKELIDYADACDKYQRPDADVSYGDISRDMREWADTTILEEGEEV